MTTARKITLSVIIVLVLGIGGLFLYVLGSLDAIVAAAIEKYGSQATGTAVRVEQVQIKLGEGRGAIRGLRVANPAGFSAANAFVLDEISVGINLEALADKNIVIDEIKVLKPAIFYEINAQRQGNLSVLKANLAQDARPATRAEGGEAETLALTIKRLAMQDATLQARVVPLENRQYQLKLPPLVLTNLHGTPQQITRQILDQLIRHAETAARKAGIDRELEKYKAAARQKLEAEKARLQGETATRLEQEKSKAADKLKNILGK